MTDCAVADFSNPAVELIDMKTELTEIKKEIADLEAKCKSLQEEHHRMQLFINRFEHDLLKQSVEPELNKVQMFIQKYFECDNVKRQIDGINKELFTETINLESKKSAMALFFSEKYKYPPQYFDMELEKLLKDISMVSRTILQKQQVLATLEACAKDTKKIITDTTINVGSKKYLLYKITYAYKSNAERYIMSLGDFKFENFFMTTDREFYDVVDHCTKSDVIDGMNVEQIDSKYKDKVCKSLSEEKEIYCTKFIMLRFLFKESEKVLRFADVWCIEIDE